MADETIFRTRIANRDPRYPLIIHLCNYFFAGLFMGMFLILSGVMLTTYAEEHQSLAPKLPPSVAGSVVDGDDHYQNKLYDKVWLANVLGISLLIIGCILIGLAFLTLVIASVMYLQTTTRPPEIELSDDVWHYLDTIEDKRSDNEATPETNNNTDNQV